MSKKTKIVVILGTTASGKTSLAVALARKFNGEIIAADSRQVYRGLDVGSGKDLNEYGEIKYHLIDITDPKERYSVAAYKKAAYAEIANIASQGKLPIIAGGSGQYLEAVVENYQLSDIKPNDELRESLEKLSTEELFSKLSRENLAFALKLNNSDKNNKRRLIRYLEIFSKKESAVRQPAAGKKNNFDFLLIGLTWPNKILAERIHRRLNERLEKENMIQEVSDLNGKTGLSWERLEELGLEYKFIALYLQEKIDYEQMTELLERAINQFAKKQATWFRRWEKKRGIFWIKNEKDAEKTIKNFLKS
jgi:tRNA dimethylallyltransferase